MEGQWTFADLSGEWVHDTFDTKEEAIENGQEFFLTEFLIGQLEHEQGVNYKIVNIEMVF